MKKVNLFVVCEWIILVIFCATVVSGAEKGDVAVPKSLENATSSTEKNSFSLDKASTVENNKDKVTNFSREEEKIETITKTDKQFADKSNKSNENSSHKTTNQLNSNTLAKLTKNQGNSSKISFDSLEVHHDESSETSDLHKNSSIKVINQDKNVLSYRRISSFEVMENHSDVIKCAAANSSIDQFPDDLFTVKQRQHGAVLLHLLGAIYFFTLLAVVCNDYFLPSVQCICEDLNISKDVAAATFMATATTTPEFFTNVISIFLIDSDMGLGTIIGSMTFNTLGVAAVAGLATITPVKLNAWPITRDCILFIINLSFLTLFAWDSKITLLESICMVFLYFTYFIVLFQNNRILALINILIKNKKKFCCNRNNSFDLPQQPHAEDTYSKASINTLDFETNKSMDPIYVIYQTQDSKTSMLSDVPSAKKKRKSLWRVPAGPHLRTIWWLYTWPIKFVLTFTIPNPKTWRKLYPISFILCIVWIGVNSYMIVWMVTVMGYTISIPETVMGLTFLAAGGCMPEAISSCLAIRKGEGGFGVSNSLGANSMAILMSLGFPWLVRNILYINKGKDAFITIQSEGIEYTIMSLVLATVALYIVMTIAKYHLRKCVGVVLILIYLVFISISVLIQMDILFPSGNRCVS